MHGNGRANTNDGAAAHAKTSNGAAAHANANGNADVHEVSDVRVEVRENEHHGQKPTARIRAGAGLRAAIQAEAREAARTAALEHLHAHRPATHVGVKLRNRSAVNANVRSRASGEEAQVLLNLVRAAWRTGGSERAGALVEFICGGTSEHTRISAELAALLASLEAGGEAHVQGNGRGHANAHANAHLNGHGNAHVNAHSNEHVNVHANGHANGQIGAGAGARGQANGLVNARGNGQTRAGAGGQGAAPGQGVGNVGATGNGAPAGSVPTGAVSPVFGETSPASAPAVPSPVTPLAVGGPSGAIGQSPAATGLSAPESLVGRENGATTTATRQLPFTGFELPWVLAFGLSTLAAGVALRRRTN